MNNDHNADHHPPSRIARCQLAPNPSTVPSKYYELPARIQASKMHNSVNQKIMKYLTII